MVSWPSRFEPARVPDNVSLVDLLPTFCELAGSPEIEDSIGELDGTSLVPLLDQGHDPLRDDTVYGENLAEGATAPILMVKRGSTKLVVSGCDPNQLFDLANDPHELRNVADDPAYADVRDELRAAALAKWDMDELSRRVRASQHQRKFLRSVAAQSGVDDWRHRPPDQAARHVLGHGTVYNDWAYGFTLRATQ